MKISDINRELYRDDIARVEKEIDMFQNMLRKAIINNKKIYLRAYKDYLNMDGNDYNYPDKIDIDYYGRLRNISDVNILMNNIVSKLREKYGVDFKYKKIRIYPKMRYRDLFELLPIIPVGGIITLVLSFIVEVIIGRDCVLNIFMSIYFILIILFFTVCIMYCFIYKRWLS